MDLGLELADGRGRPGQPLYGRVSRELGPDDLQRAPVGKGGPSPVLKRLSERHHVVARMLAQGQPVKEAAELTGFTPQRVTQLNSDPMFKELVAQYREGFNRAAFDFQKEVAGLTADAVAVLRERLEEAPEEFSNHELLNLLRTGADRTGNGPSSTLNQNVNVHIATRLDAARRRVAAASAQTLEVEDAEVIGE